MGVTMSKPGPGVNGVVKAVKNYPFNGYHRHVALALLISVHRVGRVLPPQCWVFTRLELRVPKSAARYSYARQSIQNNGVVALPLRRADVA